MRKFYRAISSLLICSLLSAPALAVAETTESVDTLESLETTNDDLQIPVETTESPELIVPNVPNLNKDNNMLWVGDSSVATGRSGQEVIDFLRETERVRLTVSEEEIVSKGLKKIRLVVDITPEYYITLIEGESTIEEVDGCVDYIYEEYYYKSSGEFDHAALGYCSLRSDGYTLSDISYRLAEAVPEKMELRQGWKSLNTTISLNRYIPLPGEIIFIENAASLTYEELLQQVKLLV